MDFCRIFIPLLITSITAISAASPVIFQPSDFFKRKSHIISKGEFAEIRTSVNGTDVNYWMIRNKNIQIEQFFSGKKLTKFQIYQFGQKAVKELEYSLIKGKYKLVIARMRAPEVYHYDGSIFKVDDKNLCELKEETTRAISIISKELDEEVCRANIEGKVIDPSCKAKLNARSYDNLVSAISKATTVGDENVVLNCLKDPSTAGILADAYKMDKVKMAEKLSVVSARYELAGLKIQGDPVSMKGKIVCKDATSKSSAAETIEGFGIVFYTPKDAPEEIPRSLFMKQAVHELIHDSGVKIESITSNLTAICYDKAKSVNSPSASEIACVSSGNCGSSLFSLEDTKNKVGKVADITPVNIPREVAESAFNNPSKAQIDQPISDANKVRNDYSVNSEKTADIAYERAFNQSVGPLKTAAKLLNVTGGDLVPQALAQSNSVSRSPASYGKVVGSSLNSKNLNKKNSEDEWVVTDEVMAPSDKAKEVSPKQNKPKDSSQSQGANRGEVKVDVALEEQVGGADAIRQRSSIATTSTSITNPSRGPSSIATPARNKLLASNTSMGPAQIRKILSNYELAKSKIKDPEFRRELKSNKIAITDYEGNQIVERTNGSTVYIDTGSSYAPAQ